MNASNSLHRREDQADGKVRITRGAPSEIEAMSLPQLARWAAPYGG